MEFAWNSYSYFLYEVKTWLVMGIKRGSWKSILSFYLIAIGSSVGLGNLWRFPYVVGENGGGAFVLIYLLIVLLIGIPLLIAELIIGQTTRKSILSASSLLSKDAMSGKWFSRLALILCFTVLSYYSVIAGWVLHFLTQSVINIFSKGVLSQQSLVLLMNQGWLQLALASVHLLLLLILVGKGVQEGLEKWLSYLMPVLGVLIIFLVSQSVNLPSFANVLRFLFYPDFSKLSLSSLGYALGHVFFTLSLGFGTIVTFGSYLKEEAHAPSIGFRVALFDVVLSLVVLLMIFPMAFQASESHLTDPTLMFQVLPQFLSQIPGGNWLGPVFFLSLYLAALHASVGLFETIVSNLSDMNRILSRGRASWLSVVIIILISTLPALSSSVFKDLKWNGKSFIEMIDLISINWLLPISALGMILLFNKGYSDQEKEKSFTHGDHVVSVVMFSHWRWTLRWLAPIVIIVGLLLEMIGFFKS